MAVTLTFWRLPEEESAFIEFLESSGDVVAIPWQKVSDPSLLKPRPLSEVISQDSDAILIGLRHTIQNPPINTFRDDGEESYAVPARDLPMLIYHRGKWNDVNKLRRSNLSGEWTTISPDTGRSVDQPEDFVKWGKKVMQWVRKQTPLWHMYKTYRITPRVGEAIKRGVELLP
jgi:hypothetical protein